MKKKYIFFIFIIIISVGYLYINKSIGNKTNLFHFAKDYLPQNVKIFLKKNVFVYKYKKNLEEKIRSLNTLTIPRLENKFAKKEIQLENLLVEFGYIPVQKNEVVEKFSVKDDEYRLTKFKAKYLYVSKHSSGGIGSSYLDYFENRLLISTATGIFGYVHLEDFNNEEFNIIIIPSNIKDLIKYNEFYSSSDFGVKDLLIYKDKIYISYSNQVEKDCYNTSILVADLNLKELNFKSFFSPQDCIKEENEYGEFVGAQGGGRMFPYKNNKILFSHGEYRFRDYAQNKSNLFGKIISIDIDTKEYKIISMGHRNPQGLFYDVEENIIFSTEHGPKGGDEVNIHKSPEKIENFGWPISSYGELYGLNKSYYDRQSKNSKYKNPTLYKSHKDYGFVEPLKYFVPSIGVSQVIKIPFKYNQNKKNQLLVGAMGNKIREGDLSLHYLTLNEDKTLIVHDIIPIKERVRDMIYVKEANKIFLFLETTASIGILEVGK